MAFATVLRSWLHKVKFVKCGGVESNIASFPRGPEGSVTARCIEQYAN